ncbi:glutaredoxin [Ureibacillus massiliensis 4400831 = CIP 108448 = CCUG 49529]|uniref:Glutaredoxin n=1 Tax=Ureibacillus massiliensis 4400831 = CIP 108448 = CCUG 49529 TaxID=1211035 RepID=A0A0A3JVD0_9BACL|nr:glutaredoxin family protein [Ureibacillus massiliensis]KGR90962.1 glutaredoxin [Ureibacillus massiliensis 4400831 = CIP 108448 = CCUG 49529]
MANLKIVLWAKQGCSYCGEVKSYLEGEGIDYQIIDVTEHDEFRDILDLKYGIRYVPVVEIGQGNTFTAVTELGVEHLQNALEKIKNKGVQTI